MGSSSAQGCHDCHTYIAAGIDSDFPTAVLDYTVAVAVPMFVAAGIDSCTMEMMTGMVFVAASSLSWCRNCHKTCYHKQPLTHT
jgi:hypothetical protein